MELYIPEIGDTLVLTKPWKFTLYAETRNQALASFFGYYLSDYPNKFIKESELAPMRDADYVIDYPDNKDPKYKDIFGQFNHKLYNNDWNSAGQNCPEHIQYNKDGVEHRDIAGKIGIEELEIEIPVGVELKIDRIYIRKGAKEYSSISFFANRLGEGYIKTGYSGNEKKIKRKSLRFWAKLSDCNKIEFK